MKNRTLAKQSPVKPTFYSWSASNNRANILESEIEIDFFNYLEFEHGADSFRTQPYSVEYKINGKKRRYTPDFIIETQNKVFIIEIKSYKATQCDVFQFKAQVLENFFAERGQTFKVITERDIRIGERARNLKFLQPALKMPIPKDGWRKIRSSLPHQTGTVEKLQQEAKHLGLDPSIIRRVIAHRLVKCDLTLPWPEITLSW